MLARDSPLHQQGHTPTRLAEDYRVARSTICKANPVGKSD